MKTKLLFLAFIFLCLYTKAQDSSIVIQDSILPPAEKSEIKPDRLAMKATLMSAAVPGLGQMYVNPKRYWKLPIIYGLGGYLFYRVSFANNRYKGYRDALNYRSESGDDYDLTLDQYAGFSDSQLRSRKDEYRRIRDNNIINLSLLYIANILDANVDAHLSYFKISGEEFAISMRPGTQVENQLAFVPLGLTMRITYK